MKAFTGAVVGGFIIFILQFLSWTILDLHRPAQQYTPMQDSILNYLNTHLDSSGGYLLPTVPKEASGKEMEELEKKSEGKPWVQIQYHKSLEINMVRNMITNLTVNILMILVFCWILSGYTVNTFGKTFIASIFMGLIIFLHSSYTTHIWYKLFDLEAHFTDDMLSWGLTGIWLGWWLNKKDKPKTKQ